MDNLDPEVAERSEDPVVYDGIGKAARNWECFDAIVDALRKLEADESLLIQSGKPVGVFRTHAEAPRGGPPDHSALMPALRTKSAQRASSCLSMALSSAGEFPTGSAPSA